MILLAGRYILPFLLPFLWAFLFAYLTRKPAIYLSKKMGRGQKPLFLISLGMFYLVLLAVVILGGERLLTWSGNFLSNLPQTYQTEIAPFLESVLDRIGETLVNMGLVEDGQWENSLQQFVDGLGQSLSAASGDILGATSRFVTGIPGVIVNLVITIVSSFYIAADYDRVMDFFRKHLPEKWKAWGRDVKKYGFSVLKIYLKSYSLLFLMTFAELTVGMLLMRVPYAVPIALGIAVFDILPVLGTGGILLPWMVLMLVMGNYPMALGLLVLYIVITIVRNIVEPKIVGKQMGLHPLVTLIAMFVGLGLCGLLGLILFPMAILILVNMAKNGAIAPGKWMNPEKSNTGEA